MDDAATNLRPKSSLVRSHVRTMALAAGFTEAGLVAIPYAAGERDAERFAAWVRSGRAGTYLPLPHPPPDGVSKCPLTSLKYECTPRTRKARHDLRVTSV